jgi:GNAT superfamily N-acetyltransferase
MDAGVQIRPIGPGQRRLLIEMYERFDPPGAALGLPPLTAEAREAWIDAALRHPVNLGAFTPVGEPVGHCFLAPSAPCEAELAVFVHQQSRRKGIGAALLTAALDRARAAGLRRVWSITSYDNRAALRLQTSCGFRLADSLSFEAELVILLTAPVPTGSAPLHRACSPGASCR